MQMHKKLYKIVIVSGLMLSLGIQSIDVMARLGGGSLRSSGFSNHSYSSGSSQSYYNSPQRAGSGGNVGMQRNDVVNAERRNTTSTSTNQFNSNPSVSQPATASKIGLGHVAGAAVAGAAVGYMLNSHNNNQGMQQPMQNNGGASGAFNGISNNQPTQSGFPWGTIFMLLLVGFGLMWLYKRSASLKAIGANMKEALNPVGSSTYQTPQANHLNNPTFQSDALNFFNALQDANNRGDIGFMQMYSVGDMQNSLIEEIRNRTVASYTRFSMMNAKVLDITHADDQSIASVRFSGLVSEANSSFEPMDEVWHLVRQAGEWQLAGIEQV